MIEFGCFNEMPVIAFYTYRKARVWGVSLSLTERQKDDIREYLKSNGYQTDNHICWSSDQLHFMYSDGKLFIGTSITVKSW